MFVYLYVWGCSPVATCDTILPSDSFSAAVVVGEFSALCDSNGSFVSHHLVVKSG